MDVSEIALYGIHFAEEAKPYYYKYLFFWILKMFFFFFLI